MASSILSDQNNSCQLAFCRLAQETLSTEQLLDCLILGLGCLVNSTELGFLDVIPKSFAKSNCVLIASTEVFTKHQIKAVDAKLKKKKRNESYVQIVAQFQSIDGTEKYERVALNQLYSSVDKDVCESNGIIFIALTKLSSVLRARPKLEAYDFEKECASEKENFHNLYCHILCGVKENRETFLSSRIYDLSVQESSGYACKYTYVLTNQDKKHFYTKEEFMKEEKKWPGGILLCNERQLYGVLHFRDGLPTPVSLKTGNKSSIYPKLLDLPTEESQGPTTDVWLEDIGTQKEHEALDQEKHVGASGGVPDIFQAQLAIAAEPSPFQSGSATEAELHSPLPAAEGTGASLLMTGSDKLVDTHYELKMLTQPDTTGSDNNNTYSQEMKTSNCPLVSEDSNGGSSPTENSWRSSDSQFVEEKIELALEAPNNGRTADVITGEDPAKGLPLLGNTASKMTFPQKDGGGDGHLKNSYYTNLIVKLPPKYPQDLRQDRQGSGERTADECCASGDQDKHSEQKRHSLPSTPPRAEHPTLRRCSSDMPLYSSSRKVFSLGAPLAKSLLDCLVVLERLGRCLDKEYKYGETKCWKHLAEEFMIDADVYDQFVSSRIHSPTEVLFEYLSTRRPKLNVEELKQALGDIGRQDVEKGVLWKHENSSDSKLTNETLVSTLFDSNPDIIGEMAFLLDKEKHGVKNWTHLAGKLGVPRRHFRTFETSTNENPTEKLFEYLCIHFPRLTIGQLKEHLEALFRGDVVETLNTSNKVKDSSVLKDLMDDFDVMDRVCELMNKKLSTNKVVGWKHLGNRFNIKKEILDDFSPSPETPAAGPTEVLVTHLNASRPGLKLDNLVWALHRLDRPDALIVLEECLPDGCIEKCLKSCDCERCRPANNE